MTKIINDILQAALQIATELWQIELVKVGVVAFVAVLLLTIIFKSILKGFKRSIPIKVHDSVRAALTEALSGRSLLDKREVTNLVNLTFNQLCLSGLIPRPSSSSHGKEEEEEQDTAVIPVPNAEPDKAAALSIPNAQAGPEVEKITGEITEPQEPVQEAKAKAADALLELQKIHQDDLGPSAQFFLRQDVLGKKVLCDRHYFRVLWSNLFNDPARENSEHAPKGFGERQFYSMVAVCPICSRPWTCLDISILDTPVSDVDNEEAALQEEKKENDKFAFIYPNQSAKEKAQEATSPEPEPIAAPPASSEPLTLPFGGVPADDCPDEEVMEKKEGEDEEAEAASPLPALTPTPLPAPNPATPLEPSEDDDLVKDIEEALKNEEVKDQIADHPTEDKSDDAKQPEVEKEKEPEQRKDETTVLLPVPKPDPQISSRPSITYPDSEKKEKRGFRLRISFGKHRRAEAKLQKEMIKREKRQLKWQMKRELNRQILAEAIRKRKEAEAKQLEKDLRKRVKKELG